MTEGVQYDSSKGLGPMDRLLLRGAAAHKSPNELSALTGGVLSAAACAQRVVDLLDQRDWLSEAQKRMLLMDDFQAIKDTLYEKAVTHRNLDAAGPLVAVLSKLENLLSQEKFDLASALREINRAQAQMMLSGIKAMLDAFLLEMERRHPEISTWAAESNEVFLSVMPAAVKEIESRVGD